MRPLTARVLAAPETVSNLGPDAWTDLILEARDTGLLGRLGARLVRHGLLDQVPDAPRRHLDGMARFAAKQHTDVMAEVRRIRDVFGAHGLPVVLMKGAAYVATDSPAAEGRTFEDIDLLVPEARIAEAEAALTAAGWTRPPLTPHDSRYYYEWMHQIPPMVHRERGSLVDVHHNIVPRTAAPRIDARDLLAHAKATPEPGVYALAETDLVIHSAAHLLNEGDFTNGLRDLSDLDLLLRRLLRADPDLVELRRRAKALGFGHPVSWALWLVQETCDTPVGADVPGPRGLVDRAMLASFRRAVLPGTNFAAASARAALYVRGHLLKMPVRLLVPHLLVKAARALGHDEAPG
ncbi:hypothetical protein CKO28_13010 [Rhodovibrio sodomensis]|uniref:Nucleotidyltransferase family protein n=1 Tax=Rhodovibrio sodomensis TaxID=1088 RepID=A0ABS1DG35_9PROT|nr:nucleotidyltransferase family protein [Rhodovibrio sodomensis]MBK1668951.1 hypothetical protein [Rhodovibrio sodomensis]